MHPARLAAKIQGRIEGFSGKLVRGLSRPAARMVREVLVGIQARGSVRLSEVARALDEPVAMKKVIERLGRHLKRQEVREAVRQNLLELGARRVREETLLVVDLTDVSKPHARRMEHLARVRDGSTGELTPGYWCCQVVAVERNSSEVVPLYQELYSQHAPEFESENDEVLKASDAVLGATEGRGVVVIDRGGDRRKLIRALLNAGREFVIRMQGARHVVYRGQLKTVEALAEACPTPLHKTVVRQKRGKEKVYALTFGGLRVRFPGFSRPLSLLVIRGFGRKPLMLLTTLPLGSRKRLWQIVESYVGRWRVEETIRFIKQSYAVEDIRLLTYERLRTMAVLVMAAAYFTCVYLAGGAKQRILAVHAFEASKRIFGIAAFRFYAVADGIRHALYGRTRRVRPPRPVLPSPNLSLFPMGP